MHYAILFTRKETGDVPSICDYLYKPPVDNQWLLSQRRDFVIACSQDASRFRPLFDSARITLAPRLWVPSRANRCPCGVFPIGVSTTPNRPVGILNDRLRSHNATSGLIICNAAYIDINCVGRDWGVSSNDANPSKLCWDSVKLSGGVGECPTTATLRVKYCFRHIIICAHVRVPFNPLHPLPPRRETASTSHQCCATSQLALSSQPYWVASRPRNNFRPRIGVASRPRSLTAMIQNGQKSVRVLTGW
jgi:hypothetical protein